MKEMLQGKRTNKDMKREEEQEGRAKESMSHYGFKADLKIKQVGDIFQTSSAYIRTKITTTTKTEEKNKDEKKIIKTTDELVETTFII